MIRGSEEALARDHPDALSQAAYSMRDCFQQLIEHLAPSEAVKVQPWFQPVSGPPDGVSRRQRLRFIYRSGDSVDERTLTSLDNLADSAVNSLDLCIARAHQHDPELTREEVRLSIDQGRHALIRVLKLHALPRPTAPGA
jgi:hypothetical protein